MTKDVLVSISGKHIGIVSQSDEVIEAVGTDDDEIEVVTPASYYCRNGKHYIFHDFQAVGTADLDLVLNYS